MGTSLTGLTPATTYDALIKVGDNGPLSATAKVLSDGLGNDSPLAMSTTLVGIGTASPSANLEVSRSTQQTNLGDASQVLSLINTSTDIANNATGIRFRQVNGTNSANAFIGTLSSGSSANRSSIVFAPSNSSGDATEAMRITTHGNVGIGTTSPDTRLRVKGIGSFLDSDLTETGIRIGANENYYWQFSRENVNFGHLSIYEKDNTTPVERLRFTQTSAGSYLRLMSGTGGIQFNGDTASANALDDYEEGTWTMGVSFGGGSTGVTYSTNTGRYTKIGNMVTVVGYLELSSKGTSFDAARITGLPFTIGSGNSNYAAPSLRLNRISFANQYTGFGEPNNTTIILVEQTEAGVETALNDTNFANNSEIILSFTYFV